MSEAENVASVKQLYAAIVTCGRGVDLMLTGVV